MNEDTPEFRDLHNAFISFSLDAILNSREVIADPYNTLIKNAHSKINNYFNDNDYRDSLSTTKKRSIESQISSVLSQFQTLQQWQNDSVTSIASNIGSVATNLSQNMDEFDLRFTTPYEISKLQDGRDIDAVYSKANEAMVHIQEVSSTIDTVLDDAKKITGTASSYELADHYQLMANGMSVVEYNNLILKKPSVKSIKVSYLRMTIAAIVLFILIDWVYVNGVVNYLPTRYILEAMIAILIPVTFVFYHRLKYKFNMQYPGGYSRSAMLWMFGAIVSTFLTAIYAAVLVVQMGPNPGWSELVPKIIGLIAPAYFVRFCVQNYKANMHLSIQNKHRSTVAKVVRGFSDLVTHDNPNFAKDVLNSRTELINAAAGILFTQSESGYITTKEGAGSSNDDMLESLKNVR